MKQLTEADVIRIIREEWDKKIDHLLEQSGADIDVRGDPDKDGQTEELISPGLKIKHKKSGIRYTVAELGPKDVIIKTPEGKEIQLTNDELENEYVLD